MIDETWVTRGGYEIAAGPIERPMGCKAYVVLNTDGHYDQLHMCKCFGEGDFAGQISKRGESQYDLIPGESDD